MTMYKIPIKSDLEIETMHRGGKILESMLDKLRSMVVEGIDVWDLENAFIDMCSSNKVKPACKGYAPLGYPPFPTGLCLSINDQSVHCFPIKGRTVKNGDIVTIDTVIEYSGFFLDKAVSFGVGKTSQKNKKLLETTRKALISAIEKVKPGIRVGVISNAMQEIILKEGFSVLMDYAGHGIGKSMHEIPEIPCFGQKEDGPIIQKGMVLAIEALVCEKSNILEHNNYWQTNTIDGGNFAQAENTVAVTADGYKVLTENL